MMTKNEAHERAVLIWGEAEAQRAIVVAPSSGDDNWYVTIASVESGQAVNRCHMLDGNGHTCCHDSCASREQQVTTTPTVAVLERIAGFIETVASGSYSENRAIVRSITDDARALLRDIRKANTIASKDKKGARA